MTETTNEVQDAGESTEAVPTDATNLSINDLANIKQIIDVASSRGAFKAEEYQVIGVTYDRLTAFLKSVVPQEETDAETDETVEA